MRESFVLIIALFAISVRCSTLDRDGFNMYKDHLRARPDEALEDSEEKDIILYFYRSPLQTYFDQPADVPDYRKRATYNIFKNHMLNKEPSVGKRTSKAALSLMLQSKHDIDHIDDGHYCLYGK